MFIDIHPTIFDKLVRTIQPIRGDYPMTDLNNEWSQIRQSIRQMAAEAEKELRWREAKKSLFGRSLQSLYHDMQTKSTRDLQPLIENEVGIEVYMSSIVREATAVAIYAMAITSIAESKVIDEPEQPALEPAEMKIKNLEAELERWKHGKQIESDYICEHTFKIQQLEDDIKTLTQTNAALTERAEEAESTLRCVAEELKQLKQLYAMKPVVKPSTTLRVIGAMVHTKIVDAVNGKGELIRDSNGTVRQTTEKEYLLELNSPKGVFTAVVQWADWNKVIFTPYFRTFEEERDR